jgi:hypothetical protein
MANHHCFTIRKYNGNPLLHGNRDAFQGMTVHQPGQELTAHGRQQRMGENGIHHPATTLHFGASTGHEIHDRFVEREGNLVILLNPLLNSAELQVNDFFNTSSESG